MSDPTHGQLTEMLDELRGAIDDLRLGILDRSKPNGRRWSLTVFELLDRARVRRRDKLVPAERPRARAYGDPTVGDAIERVTDEDPDLRAWRSLLIDLQTMLTYGRHAVGTLATATPAQQRPDRIEVGCRVCSRPGKPEPVYRSERCRWCYDFWRQWSCDGVSVDVPPAILRARREGKRITYAMIEAELNDVEMAG